jgi:hypothetical protein
MIKKIIKKLIPKKYLEKITNYRNRNNMLFMDDDFLSYVYKKKLGLEKELNNIKTLALRGSHADYSVFTEGKHFIYNLGLTSSDIYVSYRLYQNYSAKMNNLDNVVFFYSVFTPGLSLIKIKEKYRLVAYKYFFGIPYQEENLINSVLEKKILNKCRKIKKQKIENDYFGYEKQKSFMTSLKAEERAKTHLRENTREPDQLEWLAKLIQLIQKDKKQLYIVIPPAQKSYMDCLPTKAKLFERLYSLELGNVKILDFYGSPIFDDSDLGDFDHMNEKGAKKMTNELIKNIK